MKKSTILTLTVLIVFYGNIQIVSKVWDYSQACSGSLQTLMEEQDIPLVNGMLVIEKNTL